MSVAGAKTARDKIFLTADLANECLGFIRLAAESAQLSLLQEDYPGFRYHLERMIIHARAAGKCSIEIAEFARELPGDKVPNYQREDCK